MWGSLGILQPLQKKSNKKHKEGAVWLGDIENLRNPSNVGCNFSHVVDVCGGGGGRRG